MSHYLSLLVWLPIVGALVVSCVPAAHVRRVRWTANSFAVAGFAASVPLWFWFDSENADFQFVERLPWMRSIGAEYFLGVDGFSVLLVLLTTLMGLVAVLTLGAATAGRARTCYAVLLGLQGAMLGALLSLDGLMFFVFSELAILPLSALLAISGSGQRPSAAGTVVIYSLPATLLLLGGILSVYFYNFDATGAYAFDVTRWHTLSMPIGRQRVACAAFCIAFAMKVPAVLWRTRLPDTRPAAPTALGSVWLTAVILNSGLYGVVRFGLPIFPEAARSYVPYVTVLCLVGLAASAFGVLTRREWPRRLAYVGAGQMALGFLGLFSLNPVGMTGGMLQQVNVGLSSGALFLLVGWLADRTRSTAVADDAGALQAMPRTGMVLLVLTLSAIGVPPLNGFVGQLLILQGTLTRSTTWVAIAVGAVAVGGTLLLDVYRRTMSRSRDPQNIPALADLSVAECVVLAPILALIVWIGVYPKPFIDRLDMSVRHVIARVSPEYSQPMADCDTTVTPEMRAASPGGQFLAAAPCGPDGEPLMAPSAPGEPSPATPPK